MKTMRLKSQVGTLPVGTIMVLGLHEPPPRYVEDGRDNFWWKQGSSREDNMFLKVNWIRNDQYEVLYNPPQEGDGKMGV